MKSNIAFIIPVYNEAQVIGNVVNRVLKKYEYVVCVNDGSTDSSADEIEKTKAYLVNHPINMGQGAALQTGIDFALTNKNIKYFVTYDADGQHQIEDVDNMLSYISKHGDVDIILGSRFLGSAVNIRPLKKIILKLAVKFSNASTGIKLTDTHNGLRVFNRKVAEGLQLKMADFAHASEIIDRIAEKTWAYKELPVTIVYSDYSTGKGQSMINAINIGFDILLRKIIGK